MTVGIILVSHSAQLAEGLRELAAQMAPDVTIVAAGGTDEGEVGTSFDKVLAAVGVADTGDGVVLLYDLGSAQMTADLVLETLDDAQRSKVLLADAPLVEGAVAAATTAQSGASASEVAAAAAAAWGRTAGTPDDVAGPAGDALTHPGAGAAAPEAVRATAVLPNPLGLHARPAAMLARAVGDFDADVRVGAPGAATVDAKSVLGVISLGFAGGQEIEVSATGPQAQQAVDTVIAMVKDGFGES